MSAARTILVDVLLGLTVASCWLGALGLIRMRDPFQTLHYLSFPAILGMGALTTTVFVETGWSQASWKCGIILVVFLASNSVGTHAAARAFRQRTKGHWEAEPNDPEIEFLASRPRK